MGHGHSIRTRARFNGSVVTSPAEVDGLSGARHCINVVTQTNGTCVPCPETQDIQHVWASASSHRGIPIMGIPGSSLVRYSTVQYIRVQYSGAQHSTQHSAIQCCTVYCTFVLYHRVNHARPPPVAFRETSLADVYQ